jgi:hypothetical protein
LLDIQDKSAVAGSGLVDPTSTTLTTLTWRRAIVQWACTPGIRAVRSLSKESVDVL